MFSCLQDNKEEIVDYSTGYCTNAMMMKELIYTKVNASFNFIELKCIASTKNLILIFQPIQDIEHKLYQVFFQKNKDYDISE